MANKMIKNDEAVSPIVATLVLIVVAIVGAAAVGLLLGTFSNDVSKQANAGDTASQASTSLLIAGSTSMQPMLTALGKNYTLAHDGVKVVVSGGGSGYGAIAAGSKTADLGAMSEALNTAQIASYPTLVSNLVAYDAVVVIANPSATSALTFTRANLIAIYTTGVLGTDNYNVYYRSDASGTQDTFLNALGLTVSSITGGVPAGQQKPVNGNGAMITGVKSAGLNIGFTDESYIATNNVPQAAASTFGYATVSGFTSQGAATGTPTFSNVKAAITNADGSKYPQELLRGWYLVSNGPATGVSKNFIDYCRDPSQAGLFNANYVTHFSQLPASLVPAA